MPSATETATAPKSVLTWPKLLGILFLACVGGAYGLEGAVGAAGPFWTLLAIIILPWLWGYPMCLMASELSATFPSNAGPIHWAYIGCGPFWTLQAAIWTLVMNFMDNALYPAMFASYILKFLEDQHVHLCEPGHFCWPEAGLKGGLVLLCALLNIIGVEAVGWASIALTIGVISPFAALFCGAIPFLKPKRWVDVRPLQKVTWENFIPIVTWNLNGMDGAGHISEEIHQPQRTYRIACCGLLILTQLVYILPVLGGVSVNDSYDKWRDGYFVQVAGSLGDHYHTEAFSYWMMIGGAIANTGLMSTLLCTTSRAIYGTATLKVFPNVISKPLSVLHSRFGTPWVAVILNGLVTTGLSIALDFEELVGIDVALYSCRLILEFVALYRLRSLYPNKPRPFRISGGKKTIIAMSIFPIVVCVANVVLALMNSIPMIVTTAGVLVLTAALGILYVIFWPDRLRHFEEIEVEDTPSIPDVTYIDGTMFETDPEGDDDDDDAVETRPLFGDGAEQRRHRSRSYSTDSRTPPPDFGSLGNSGLFEGVVDNVGL
eukprot:TRINITY_DN46898_c0_g1_i1.p1 TRINITY_DN46898_c0_g1~~TRINITY_DN46898_c0_g1_i1.p1  ORF type:complete len:546 (+),score=11.42 TRINITY_DN46898_c0_g1_i1:141-1778(+)